MNYGIGNFLTIDSTVVTSLGSTGVIFRRNSKHSVYIMSTALRLGLGQEEFLRYVSTSLRVLFAVCMSGTCCLRPQR